MKEIPEGSESFVYARPVDASGAAITPISMRYRIDCLTTCTVILDWTAVSSPTSSNTITVTATQNRIICQDNRRERRQMVVETTSGSGGVRNDPVDWEVKNLHGVS